jgi:ATP-dependent RNA/DNA helicase IGHMBP2
VSARADAWLEQLGELWRRERAAAQARFLAQRAEVPLAERVERGLALRDLHLADVDAAPGGRVQLWLEPRVLADLDGLRLGSGDPVRLWWSSPDEADAVLAIFARRTTARVAVIVEADWPERLEGGRFHLDADAPQVTFERGERALARVRDAKGGSDLAYLREVLGGDQAPSFDALATAPTALDAGLNPPQLAAVARSLAARDVALVHGPPGTGKTRTLVEIVRQLVARGERVLATAASNAAVDNLAARLVDAGVPLVRLGHPARVDPAVEAWTLDAQLEANDTYALTRTWLSEARALRRRAGARRERGGREAQGEIRELLGEARRLEVDARQQMRLAEAALLARTPVVCATCVGADVPVLSDVRFDTVVIDEATQAPDPIALVALTHGGRGVLAGDPQQLPPTVIDVEAARAGLATTLFERLAARDADVVRLLTVQHRMHATIMAFPSASKYEGRLVAAPQVAAHTLEDLGVAADPLRPGPLVFVDSAGKGWSEERAGGDASTSNPGQAERTAAEVRRLLARGLPPGDLAVITPYDAQARLLRERLAAEHAAGVEIGTVDGFQGREKEAVIVDLVRSNDDHAIGFLADTRRMNVALTRARRFLLVLGDSATLGHAPYYADFLATVERLGLYVSAWADDAPLP